MLNLPLIQKEGLKVTLSIIELCRQNKSIINYQTLQTKTTLSSILYSFRLCSSSTLSHVVP